jgi:hypothetical protein
MSEYLIPFWDGCRSETVVRGQISEKYTNVYRWRFEIIDRMISRFSKMVFMYSIRTKQREES